MGKTMQMPFSCDQNNQRLNIHDDLCPAKYHEAETTLQQSFNEYTGAHMNGGKWHG